MITEYRRDGYHATLVRSERLSDGANGLPRFVAIYERTKANTPSHYEVCVLRGVGGSTIGGVDFPPRLLAPSPQQWGSMGWTYNELQRANEKMAEVMSR